MPRYPRPGGNTREAKAPEVDLGHRWTLTYSGIEKVYTLTEYQRVGNEWWKLAETQWSYLDAPLEHIRKTEKDREKGLGG